MIHSLASRRLRGPMAAGCCLAFLLMAAGNAYSDDAANVEPFIGEPTCLVIKVDTSRLTLPESFEQVASVFGAEISADAARQAVAAIRRAADGQPVYATLGIPYSERDFSAFVFVKDTGKVDMGALLGLMDKNGFEAASAHKGMLVTVPKLKADAASQLERLQPAPRKELRPALDAVADFPVQVLLLPPEFVRRTMVELEPTLPPVLGGGPSSVLTEGVLWAALGIDPAKSRVELVVQSASERAARELSDYLPKLVEAVYQALPQVQRWLLPHETLEALTGLISSTVEGDRLVIRFAQKEGLQFLASMIATVREQAVRSTNTNKFKQLGLALHNHYDTYRVFPPRAEVRDKTGKSGLSWRVHLLPYVEEGKLYEQFHLDEPWDSPHNKPLIEKMPEIYRDGLPDTPPGKTTFLTPVGEDTLFGDAKPMHFGRIWDGTSNTAWLVQVKPELAVPWTAPQDYAFAPKDPAKGLLVDDDGRFLVGIADGSIHHLRANAKPETLLNLFRKGDRQPLDWKELR